MLDRYVQWDVMSLWQLPVCVWTRQVVIERATQEPFDTVHTFVTGDFLHTYPLYCVNSPVTLPTPPQTCHFIRKLVTSSVTVNFYDSVVSVVF